MNGFNSQYLTGNLVSGKSALSQAVNDTLKAGLGFDLNMNNHKVINAQDPQNNQDYVTLQYFNSHSGGAIPISNSLNVISNNNPTSGTVLMNNQNFSGLTTATQNGQAINFDQYTASNTTLQTNINTVQTNLDTETTNRTNADTTLQNQINTLSAGKSLNQISVSNLTSGTVNMNNFPLNNVSAIQQSGINFIQFDNSGSLNVNLNKTARQTGIFASLPNTDDNQLIPQGYLKTYVQSKIDGTAVSDLLPPSDSTSTSQFPVVLKDNKLFQSTVEYAPLQSFDLISVNSPAQGSITASSQKIINLQNGSATNDAVNYGQMILYTPLTTLSQYSTTSQNDLKYYANTAPLQSITLASGSLNMNSQKIINCLDPINAQDVATKAFVLANIGQGGLPSNSTLNSIASTNLTSADVSLNSFKLTNVANGVLNSDATNLGQVTSQISTALVPYQSKLLNDQQYYWISNLPFKIQHSSASSYLDCSGSNRIDIKANGNVLGYFFQPTGQATTPLGLLTNDKLQLQSGMNSFTFYGNNQTPVNNLVYSAVRSQCTDVPSQNCYCGIEMAPSGLTTLNACMTMSSGHANLLQDGIQRPFMSIIDQNNSLNTVLSISCVNPILQPTNSSYTQYTTAFATGLSLPQHSFQGTAGYNALTTISSNNQFTSKKYVDDSITTNNTLYYTKIAVDAFTLNKWAVPTTSLNLNNQRIINVADPINPQEVATRAFVLANGGGLPSNSTLNSIATTNLTSGSVDINSNKIINLATPTLANDAVNKSYADNLIAPQTQQYTYLNSSITNGSYADIVHNLGSDLDGLVFQIYVKYKAATNNYTVNQWVYLSTIDRSSTFASQLNLQFMSHTVDIANQCRVYFCADGVATINYTGGAFSSPNWSAMSLKVVITKQNGFLVLSSQYATSNLTVNSNIDMLNSYVIDNLIDPVSNQQAATKNYIDSNFITQTQADARYYQDTTAINNMILPTASLNLNSQRIINLQQGTQSSDAVTLSQTNTLISNAVSNYIPTSVRSSDNTAGLVANSNRVDITGRSIILANSITGGVNNSNIYMNTGGGTGIVVRTGVEAGIVMLDNTVQSQVQVARYTAMILGSSSFNSAVQKSLYCRGELWCDSQSGVANLNTLMIVNGQVQATGFIVLTPSYSILKKDIQLFDFTGFDNIRYYTFLYDEQACINNGVDYISDQVQHGFIADEVPQQYCNPQTYSLQKSKLQADLIGYLLDERRKMAEDIMGLKSMVGNLISRVAFLESK